LTKTKLLFYLAGLVLTLIILRLIPANLDWRIANVRILSLELWIAIFLFFVAIYKPNSFFSREMIWAYAYALVVLVMDIIGHLTHSSATWLSAQVRPFLLALILYQVFLVRPDLELIKKMVLFIVAIIGISCLINIVGLMRNPLAVRFVVGGAEGAEGRDRFTRMGISNYGFFSGLPTLLPVLFYSFRKTAKKKFKWLFGIVIFLVVWAVFLSAFTAPLLIALMALVLSIFGNVRSRRGYTVLLIVVGGLMSLIYPPQLAFNHAIDGLISITPTEAVRRRLNDIKLASQEGIEVTSTGRTETSVEQRLQRVFWSVETVARYPLFGSSKNTNPEAFHLFWLYFLASFGLVGFLPFFLSWLTHIRRNKRVFDQDFWFYYVLSLLTFFTMGLIKSITGWFMYLAPLFIVPAMYYLTYEIPEPGLEATGESAVQASKGALQ
jgi:hypothetical protein